MYLYDALNRLLRDGHFDTCAELLCEPFYDAADRRSISPGVYFRMIFVGYFEGIDAQRCIAWRCQDSLSLTKFPGYPSHESTPDYSSLTRIIQRLPLDVFEKMFVLSLVEEYDLMKGKTVLEANAAMKSFRSQRYWPVTVCAVLRQCGMPPISVPGLTESGG
jgi:transposase